MPVVPEHTAGTPAAERLARVRLYVVTAAEDPPERVLTTVRAARDAGAEVVQLRRKGEDARLTLRLAERCRELVPPGGGTLFIVNDRVDIAMAAGADGVHLGQAFAAQAEGADYIGVGPVWATPTKPGRPAVGLELVRAVAAARLRIPWVAIGGVDGTTVDAVLAAGARAVAAVRAVTAASDPEAAARGLHAAVRAAVVAAS